MNTKTHQESVNFIWDICNLLRGPYKRNEYRKVILPLTVLRRFDCMLTSTKQKAVEEFKRVKSKPKSVVRSTMKRVTKFPFYNTSKMDFQKLLDDPDRLAINLNSYINAFSPNVRGIIEKFAFGQQIAKMHEKNLLFEVVKKFSNVDLSTKRIDNTAMGYIFEELIRRGAEQSNEEAGEHFTPREVIILMVNLLLSTEQDLNKDRIVKTIYDPACGTGGMLSVAESYIKQMNNKSIIHLYGQDWNDEAWAICKSDMLIKNHDAENIILGDTFTKDGFSRRDDDQKWTFDYLLANPPFGVEWKQQRHLIEDEANKLGYSGRFGAGTPRINDGALLFLQHMISKMRPPNLGGSRIGIVFNGSPLFTGDAGQGESNIRQWIIENDWLEAVIALPEQLFYNTGIATYIWILANRKEKNRKGKIQLIDARDMWLPMDKSLGNKRRRIGGEKEEEKGTKKDHIHFITQIHGDFLDNKKFTVKKKGKDKTAIVSKIFDNDDFGYRKITIERPLRLNFCANAEKVERLKEENAFKNMTKSKKKNAKAKAQEEAQGQARQEEILKALGRFSQKSKEKIYHNREKFKSDLEKHCSQLKFSAAELKAILNTLGERDEKADACQKKNGDYEFDSSLKDHEIIPLKEDINAYLEKEVYPHVPDAVPDMDNIKIGYEIPFNKLFYVYDPPRALEEIEGEIKSCEREITKLCSEVII